VSFLANPILIRLCRIAIGIIFGWAALAKIGDPVTFAGDVHNFRLVPVALENLVAMTLPWVELVAAIALVLDIRGREAAVLSLALLAAFTLGVAQAMARGLDFECGCFGTDDGASVGGVKLLQNLGMMAICWIACLRARS
jgi:uncharacterized membrane protein YphA (DoxX/SURF4 family)